MPFGIGIWEILILLLVVLLVFGPKRLPEMGRSLGKGMREFKDSISGDDKDDDDEPMHKRLATELPPAEVDTPSHIPVAETSPVESGPAESRERDSVS
ncbi:MAG: twin-arginine translocase TatA/TatE family subunit [Actinobacteria bacterium]|nr:twin-arginine translocase TatA/TatE family subunit [Actinomycetota bacterium]